MRSRRTIRSTRPNEKVYIRCLYCDYPVKRGSGSCPDCESTDYAKRKPKG